MMASGKLSRQLCAAVGTAMDGRRVQPPEAGRVLWNAFQRLSASRTYNPAGPNPIQPSEIEAFCRITRLPLAPHHVAILMDMDGAWLERAYARQKPAPEGVKTLPPVSAHGLTAELLDLAIG